ncbi:NADPH-dependent 7-cyano-7-deazaguanine reductase QueF [Agaribacter flavus]|uniref:NADPH-dependent 7-cyano-7-deazaguanine reductase n=1 Tax=Agaribacter flavus TaxID=1902781 RepID=A0ABV7FNN9_9ALTE
MKNLSLGKIVEYPSHYTPEVLQAVPRSIGRKNISLNSPLPFTGVDIWNAYEVSWLNTKGKPMVAIVECTIPIDSPNLIESKSFKLYLNSLNQSKFETTALLLKTMERDLSNCAGAPVGLKFIHSSDFDTLSFGKLEGNLIDELDISVSETDIDPNFLHTNDTDCEESLVSHLLKSNCLITNQPDWGSVLIRYAGKQINHEGLLRYIISFRQHNEFHEQCVERIFKDIMQQCKPSKLTVYARYTRRGGLDINPFRSNFELPYSNARLARQ